MKRADWHEEFIKLKESQRANPDEILGYHWTDKASDMLDKFVEMARYYESGKHIMQESEPTPGNVCDPIGHRARKTLADYEKG